MPRRIIPTDAQIAICARVLFDRNEVVIPDDKLRKIVESEPRLVRHLRHYSEDETGLDTYDRGYLYFAVAKSLGFEDWPCLSSAEKEDRDFLLALIDAEYVPGLSRDNMEKYWARELV